MSSKPHHWASLGRQPHVDTARYHVARKLSKAIDLEAERAAATKLVTLGRLQSGIPNSPKRTPTDAREGPFTADEAAAQLSVTSSTIHRWLANGILPGKQIAPGAPWRILLTDDLRARLTRGAAPEGWLGLTDAARELGLSKSQVAYLVKTGKLPAIRVVVANRPCWRIDVSVADCRQQERLLDQMNNAVSEEA